jgi:zinc transporter ZupT
MASLSPYDVVRRASVALMAAFIAIFARVPSSEAQNPAPATYTEITWEHLLPESWPEENPFSGLNLESLSDNDPLASRAMEAYLAKRRDAPPNGSLQGRQVKISGFVVPLERENKFSLKEFLLVPYFGACIHVPPPPQNQVIHVTPHYPLKGIQAMDTVSVYGKIIISESSNTITDSVYYIEADNVEVYNKNTMSNIIQATFVTLLCGLSLCFCLLLLYKMQKISLSIICCSISFSAGIMSCIGISSVVMNSSFTNVSLFVINFIFTSVIIRLLHKRNSKDDFCGRMQRSGKFTALAVAVHSLPEYFAVFSAAMAEPALGLVLSGAVVAHNIPLGASIAFLSHQGSRNHTLPRSCLLLSGLIPAVAAILLYLFMRSFLPASLETLFSCAGGIMTSIAITDLLPSAKQHGKYSHALCGYCAGIFFMFLLLAFFYHGNGNGI